MYVFESYWIYCVYNIIYHYCYNIIRIYYFPNTLIKQLVWGGKQCTNVATCTILVLWEAYVYISQSKHLSRKFAKVKGRQGVTEAIVCTQFPLQNAQQLMLERRETRWESIWKSGRAVKNNVYIVRIAMHDQETAHTYCTRPYIVYIVLYNFIPYSYQTMHTSGIYVQYC